MDLYFLTLFSFGFIEHSAIGIQFMPYYCTNDLNVLRILSYIRNHPDVFFITLTHKIIKLKLPSLEKKSYSGFYYSINLPTFIETDEYEKPEKLVGYSTARNEKNLLVLSELIYDKNRVWNVPLTFREGLIPGSRLSDRFENDMIDETADFSIYYEFSKSEYIYIKYNFKKRTMKITCKGEGNNSGSIQFYINYKIKNANIMYGDRTEEIFLIELRENNFFYFNVFKPIFFDKRNLWKITIQTSVGDLLGCHQVISDLNPVSGVYYLNENQIFYIIIGRYYLKIEERDLMETNFIITDSDYKNAKDFKFKKTSTWNNLDFSIPNNGRMKKRVKNLVYYYFKTPLKVRFTDNNDLELFELDDSLDIEDKMSENCFGDVIFLQLAFFCIEDLYYYKISNRFDKIIKYRIFEFLGNGDDPIIFIFDYKKKNLAFMTKKSLYLVELEKMSVDHENKKIKFDGEIQKIKNCLFISCKENDKSSFQSTSIYYSTYKSSSFPMNRKKKVFSPSLFILVTLGFLGLLFIIGSLLFSFFVMRFKVNNLKGKRRSRDKNLKIRNESLFKSSFKTGLFSSRLFRKEELKNSNDHENSLIYTSKLRKKDRALNKTDDSRGKSFITQDKINEEKSRHSNRYKKK